MPARLAYWTFGKPTYVFSLSTLQPALINLQFGSAENSEKQPSFGTTFAKQVCEDMRESFIWSDIVGKWVRRWRETGFISQD